MPHGTQGLCPPSSTCMAAAGYTAKRAVPELRHGAEQAGICRGQYRLPAGAGQSAPGTGAGRASCPGCGVHGSEYHADPDNVSLCGDSAGAYISALAACLCDPHLADFYQVKPAYTHFNAIGVCCGCSIWRRCSPAVSRVKRTISAWSLGGRITRPSPYYAYSSVLANMTEQFPPCYILGTHSATAVRRIGARYSAARSWASCTTRASGPSGTKTVARLSPEPGL